MSLSKVETFEISTPSPPPGFPPLFRRRLRELGYGEAVDRETLEQLCGSASAANQFLDKASKMGALIPTGWGSYEVAGEQTLSLISRIVHEPFQRFIAWSRHLPDIAGRQALFVAPYLWRDTQLNIQEPMPVIPLSPEEEHIEGFPPQWDAFYMDVDEPLEWILVLGGDEVGAFATPGPLEIALILATSLDPRWQMGITEIARTPPREELARALRRLHTQQAPRGSQAKAIGRGPPHRRRFLAPPWYMHMVQERLTEAALAWGDRHAMG